MSYRKLNVNGVVYEYTIGKKFTKIKNFGIFENAKIGNPVIYFDGGCYSQNDNPTMVPTGIYVVSPAVVKAVILGQSLPIVFKHTKHDGRKIEIPNLMVGPFDAEIYGKTIYFAADYQSYCNMADDI